MRYLMLGAGLLIAVFTFRTALLAFRSQIEHPWLWTFVCLVCAPVATLYVDTGTLTTQILAANLLGIGYMHALPNGPNVIHLAFPAGAVLYLNRRRKLISMARPMMPEDQLPS
jgi:uncharacterized membrane protein